MGIELKRTYKSKIIKWPFKTLLNASVWTLSILKGILGELRPIKD